MHSDNSTVKKKQGQKVRIIKTWFITWDLDIVLTLLTKSTGQSLRPLDYEYLPYKLFLCSYNNRGS